VSVCVCVCFMTVGSVFAYIVRSRGFLLKAPSGMDAMLLL